MGAEEAQSVKKSSSVHEANQQEQGGRGGGGESYFLVKLSQLVSQAQHLATLFSQPAQLAWGVLATVT